MKRTTYAHDPNMTLDVTSCANKRIILPFDEVTYSTLLQSRPAYKAFLAAQIQAHPELFPPTIQDGWTLHGLTDTSTKQGIRLRRIQTTADGEVWQIHSSFLMPYMTCDTATAEQILFLAKWAPDWALARVFKKDVMTIYRLRTSLGRYNLVGTTVKTPAALPTDVVADEKHSTLAGERVYIATTAGNNCFLGASISSEAGDEALTTAYRQFQHEAQQVQLAYQPTTVNTDGWSATRNAWKTLFPQVCVIQCFLHAVLGLKQVATNASHALYQQIVDVTWHVYHATTKRSFAQRVRRLREWGETLADSPLKGKLLKLCGKSPAFASAYDHPTSLRTSNMIDRLMQGMEKYLFAKSYFHGTLISAERGIRAYCLLTNFRPPAYNPIAHMTCRDKLSPFEQLNGFSYHENWLHNLLIATSCQEIYRFQQKKLE
ncbi:hypothetical protein U14_04218 [Candidatus Moduliflexus flocculans]|uniref:MULE transposase domain-containing protein n=1 Tax=Candidatus Moduliflexus flocculans TaxID=1499966 RepID=A0A0S6W3J9_9BACT|nr:hypothetical protein U14_04218 [Candidatus Moduliflexus flocculans]